MARLRLPQVDPKAALAPISLPNVTVATDDPVSAVQAQIYSNITSRIDTMRASVEKMALKQGETTGLAQGAASATELLELAKLTGKPITAADLPGDPSSFSVIEQAAYRGGLAVVTSQFAVDGRKAITEAALAASQDPNVSPGAFAMRLNNIVKDRTDALRSISPGEAAKLSATLSIVANSTGVSQARSFFTQQKSLRKAKAIANVSVFQNDIMAIISGYRIEPGEPSLQEKIDTELIQLEHHLITEGVPDNIAATKLKAVRAAIVDQKIGVIKAYARNHAADPTSGIFGVILQLQSKTGKVADRNIQAIFKSLDVVGKNKLIDALRTEHNAEINFHRANEDGIAKRAEKTVFNLTQTFLENLESDRPKALAAIVSMRKLDPEQAAKLQERYNEGPKPDTVNNPVVREYVERMRYKEESVTHLQELILNDPELSAGERAELAVKLATFQDTKFERALRIARADIGIDPGLVRSLGPAATPERRRLLAVYEKLHGKMERGMLDPGFDPVLFVDIELPKIEIQETRFLLGVAQKAIRTRIQGIPGWEQFDLTTIAGLEALNAALKGYKKNKAFNLKQLNRAQFKITDAKEHLEALAALGVGGQ